MDRTGGDRYNVAVMGSHDLHQLVSGGLPCAALL